MHFEDYKSLSREVKAPAANPVEGVDQQQVMLDPGILNLYPTQD
jgi:hypothetical protein